MRVAVVTWKYPNRSEPFVVDLVTSLTARGIDCVAMAEPDRRRLRRRPAWVGDRADIVHFVQLNQLRRHLRHLPRVRGATMVTIRGSDVCVAPLVSSAARSEVSAALASVDRIHCLSDHLAERCLELGAPAERLHVVPLGINRQRFAPRTDPPRWDDGEMHIISVGRLHWVKGYGSALHAVRLLLDAGRRVTYTIVGLDSGGGESVRLAIRDLGLDDAVTLASHVRHEDVRAALARSDVFLLPSVSEGLSQAAVEAMAVGLPVVVTDVGAMRELVGDGERGRVVPARQPEALAAAVADLACPESREELGRRAAAHVHACLDAEPQTDRLVAMYRELVVR